MSEIKHSEGCKEWVDSRTASINKACEEKDKVFVPLFESKRIFSTRDIIASHIGSKGINQIEIHPEIIDKINSELWIKKSDVLECLREIEKIEWNTRVYYDNKLVGIKDLIKRVFGSITKR